MTFMADGAQHSLHCALPSDPHSVSSLLLVVSSKYPWESFSPKWFCGNLPCWGLKLWWQNAILLYFVTGCIFYPQVISLGWELKYDRLKWEGVSAIHMGHSSKCVRQSCVAFVLLLFLLTANRELTCELYFGIYSCFIGIVVILSS